MCDVPYSHVNEALPIGVQDLREWPFFVARLRENRIKSSALFLRVALIRAGVKWAFLNKELNILEKPSFFPNQLYGMLRRREKMMRKSTG